MARTTPKMCSGDGLVRRHFNKKLKMKETGPERRQARSRRSQEAGVGGLGGAGPGGPLGSSCCETPLPLGALPIALHSAGAGAASGLGEGWAEGQGPWTWWHRGQAESGLGLLGLFWLWTRWAGPWTSPSACFGGCSLRTGVAPDPRSLFGTDALLRLVPKWGG